MDDGSFNVVMSVTEPELPVTGSGDSLSISLWHRGNWLLSLAPTTKSEDIGQKLEKESFIREKKTRPSNPSAGSEDNRGAQHPEGSLLY